MSAGTQPIPVLAVTVTPAREGALTERIGRLERTPGAPTEPPPMQPGAALPMTAPTRGRRGTRDTMPLYPRPTDGFDLGDA